MNFYLSVIKKSHFVCIFSQGEVIGAESTVMGAEAAFVAAACAFAVICLYRLLQKPRPAIL